MFEINGYPYVPECCVTDSTGQAGITLLVSNPEPHLIIDAENAFVVGTADCGFTGYHWVIASSPASVLANPRFASYGQPDRGPDLRVFPTPLSRTATIAVHGSQLESETVSIFNSLGKFVSLLHRPARRSECLEWTWSGTDAWGQPVCPGIYWAVYGGRGYSLAERIIVLR